MQMPTHAGWFDDPADPNQLRYFDGVIWTSHTAPRTTRPAQGGPQQPGQQQYPGQGHPPQYPGQPQQQAPPGTQPPATQQWQVPNPGQPQQYQQPSPQFPGAPQQGGWNAPSYGGLYNEPSTPDGQPLAGYLQRVGAYIIDGLILFLILLVPGAWLIYKSMQPFWDEFWRAVEANDPNALNALSPATNINYGYLFAFALLTVALQFAYSVFFLSRSGATPGKSALGISVRLRERPGVLSVPDAAKRASLQAGLGLLSNVPLAGLLFSLAALLDLLWPLWDDKRQALHDKLAATNVVRGRQPRP
jgi:uncharacterized RDD family membrane protein YckC